MLNFTLHFLSSIFYLILVCHLIYLLNGHFQGDPSQNLLLQAQVWPLFTDLLPENETMKLIDLIEAELGNFQPNIL